jgi:hypothetical protein
MTKTLNQIIFFFLHQNQNIFFHELKIEVLLFGDDTLTEMQNLQIFKSVQLYIKRTKRFTHL